MDRLELVVQTRDLHQRWKGVRLPQIALELVETLSQMLRRRRWNVEGILDATTGRADPVLRVAEVARIGVFSANAGHEDAVGLAQQPQPDGGVLSGVEQVVHGGDVVRHLTNVADSLVTGLDLEQHQVRQGGLGTLDTAGQDRLSTEQRPGEQVRARQGAPHTGELAEGAIGVGEQAYESIVEGQHVLFGMCYLTLIISTI